MDVDVIVALDHENSRAAIESLLELGFSSRIPEDPLGFASAQRRSQWIDEKHMMVLTMIDPSNPFFAIDLFIDPPIAYEELAKEAEVKLLGGVEVAVCSLEDLLRMKRLSGRSEDMADIEALGGLD